MTTQVQTTADELLRLPKGDNRYELIRGAVERRWHQQDNEHGLLALEFAAELRNFVKANKLGKVYAAETGFKLTSNPDTVRAPDAAFIRRARLDEVGPVQGYWPGAPDLIVEVISPNDLYTEVSEKVAEWLKAGSSMVVVINPRTKQVLVHARATDVKVLEPDEMAVRSCRVAIAATRTVRRVAPQPLLDSSPHPGAFLIIGTKKVQTVSISQENSAVW